MFKVFAIILSLLLFPLQGESYLLRESLQKATSGDYIVYENARFYTILFVKNAAAPLITIEEISVSVDCIKSMQSSTQFDFPLWVHQGALNSSSWITYTCDLAKGQILHTFSHTRKSSQGPSPILGTLLNLPGSFSTTRKLTSKGAPWNPPLFLQGQKIIQETEQWQAIWPHDNSPLSAANLTLFTAAPPLLPLPYWIEIQKDQKRILLRAIASGHATYHQL